MHIIIQQQPIPANIFREYLSIQQRTRQVDDVQPSGDVTRGTIASSGGLNDAKDLLEGTFEGTVVEAVLQGVVDGQTNERTSEGAHDVWTGDDGLVTEVALQVRLHPDALDDERRSQLPLSLRPMGDMAAMVDMEREEVGVVPFSHWKAHVLLHRCFVRRIHLATG